MPHPSDPDDSGLRECRLRPECPETRKSQTGKHENGNVGPFDAWKSHIFLHMRQIRSCLPNTRGLPDLTFQNFTAV